MKEISPLEYVEKLKNGWKPFFLDVRRESEEKIVSLSIDEWKKDMTELSKANNVHCKFSGIVTEVGKDYKKNQLDPYIDFILNLFGPDKLMWGSDWPVLTMADSYGNWFDLAMDYCSSFSEDEKNKIFSLNAKNFYNL